MRPKTNCNFLFLKRKIVTKAIIADAKNINGITFKVIASLENKSTTNICCFTVSHILNTKINAPETTEVNSK